MDPLNILDRIEIASPCPAVWDEMQGDDRARFCASCSKHVYNLAEMTATEAEDLLLATGGHICAQISRQADGSILTADRAVGLRTRASRRMLRVASSLAAGAGVLLTGTVLRAGAGEPCEKIPGAASKVTASAPWLGRLLDTLGLRTPPTTPPPAVTRGEIAIVPPPPRVIKGKVVVSPPGTPATPTPMPTNPAGTARDGGPVDGPAGHPE